MRRSLTLRVARWLAAALVWAAVWPGMAAAVRLIGDAPPAWAMVCTSQGMQWVALGDTSAADAAADPDGTGQSEAGNGAMHCLWCRLQTDLPADLLQAPTFFPACSMQADVPAAWAGTGPPTARHILLTAAPRAPPG